MPTPAPTPKNSSPPPDSPIFHAAQSQGLTFVGLYVYPPLLADLLLPLTAFKLSTATQLWFGSNVFFLVLTALLLTRLLKFRLLSPQTALLLLATLCFTPALQCLVDGQITIFLLLLWAAGMLLYQEDHVAAAAAVFALATAIKLTPALILLPFLLWRRWRFVAAFTLSLLSLALLSLWADTPTAFATYFARVLPAMSGSIPFFTNYSLPAATQRLVTLLQTGSIAPYPPTLPPTTVLLGRLASTGVLLALLALIARQRHATNRRGEVLILGLLALMAPILSPVSWFHAYATALLAFALLWYDCFTRNVSTSYLVSLTLVTLLLGTPVSENLMATLQLSDHHVALATWLQFLQLLAASALALYRIGHQPQGDLGRRHPQADPGPNALTLPA